MIRFPRWTVRFVIVPAVALVAFAGGYLFRSWVAPAKAPPEGTAASETHRPPEEQWWTCSMHPQIKLPKPGLCPICRMPLIPLEAGAGSLFTTTADVARHLLEIQTARVERRFVTAEVRMSGRIYYDETHLRYITAWVPGRIDRLHVDYTGVPVKRGEHMADLYSPDLISAQEELIQAIQAVRELKKSGLGTVREAGEAMVEAARSKLRLLGLTLAQIAAIEKRGRAADHVTIYAPIGGIVIEKYIKQGQYVRTGTRLYTIADLSEVWVRLDAYESDLIWLRPGQKVTFTTEAYPGETFVGRIALIGPEVNPRTRSVEVRVTVPNPEGKLKPNLFVRALVRATVAAGGKVISPELAGKWFCTMHPNIVKDTAGTCDRCGMPLVRADSRGHVAAEGQEKPLVIPATAPLITGRRAVVYVRVPGAEIPTFEGREIVLGPRAGDFYLVESGLREGELVVTHGNFKIDSALQILAKPSMMRPGKKGLPPPKPARPAARTGKAPAAFQRQLAALLDAYLALAGALAADDFKKARSAVAAARDTLRAVEMKTLSGAAHKDWMKELPNLEKALDDLSRAKDLAALRVGFALFSETLPVVIRRLGVGDAGPVYQLRCPMAFNNRGAIWLQKDREVRNPYFGARMLQCGDVIETLGRAAGAEERANE